MSFGKRGLVEYQARQEAARACNASPLEAVRAMAAVMDRLVEAGDGVVGYLVERPELTGTVAQFELSSLTAAMTYRGVNGDLYLVLGHAEPPNPQDYSEHTMLYDLAGNLAAAQKTIAGTDLRSLPDRPSAEDLEPFGEPVLATVILQATVLKCYLAVLARHIGAQLADTSGIEGGLEAIRRKGQADMAAAVRRWAARNMAHYDRAEAILMEAKIPLVPVATGNSAADGTVSVNGIWVPDHLAAIFDAPAARKAEKPSVAN